MTVSSLGSTWSELNFLTVGNGGTGALTIESGATVSSTAGEIGDEISGDGTVTVTGPGSTWTNSGNLTIGRTGIGMLTVALGGTVSSALSTIGNGFGGPPSSVVVKDPGSLWSTGVFRIVAGTLTVQSGGAASSVSAILGKDSDSGGTGGDVFVTGTNSTWTISSTLFVGFGGQSNLVISAGGAVSSGSASIGLEVIDEQGTSAGPGSVQITGLGSVWNVNGTLTISLNDDAVISILDGGTLTTTTAFIGTDGTSSFDNVAVSVGGAGSAWINSDSMYVGGTEFDPGQVGTLTVNTGGNVEVGSTLKLWQDGAIFVAGGMISAGTVETVGTSFNWTTGTVAITGPGGFALGSVSFAPDLTELTTGQTFNVTNTLTIGASQFLYLTGGVLKAGTVALNGGNIIGTTLDFDGIGNLTSTGLVAAPVAGTAPGSSITATGPLTLDDGTSAIGFEFGGTLDTGGNQVIILDADAANLGVNTNLGPGGLLQALNGSAIALGETVTATGNATITGDFLNDGTVNGPAGLGEFLTLHDDVTGSGSGNYTGSILFDDNFSPGSSPAAISLESAAIAGSLTIELGGLIPGTDFDVLNFGETAMLGGILDVQLINGFTPAPGDAFTFIQAAMVDGTFDTLLFPNVPWRDWDLLHGGH